MTARRQIRYAGGRSGRGLPDKDLPTSPGSSSRPRILNCSPHNVDRPVPPFIDDDFSRYWQPVNILYRVIRGKSKRTRMSSHDNESRSLLAGTFYTNIGGIERSMLLWFKSLGGRRYVFKRGTLTFHSQTL